MFITCTRFGTKLRREEPLQRDARLRRKFHIVGRDLSSYNLLVGVVLIFIDHALTRTHSCVLTFALFTNGKWDLAGSGVVF